MELNIIKPASHAAARVAGVVGAGSWDTAGDQRTSKSSQHRRLIQTLRFAVCLCLFGRAHATHTKVRRGELFFLALITSSKLQPRTGMAKCSCKQLHVTNAFFSAAAEAFGGPSANIGKVTPHAIATNSDLWHLQTPLPATSCNTPQARLRREPHEDVTL